MPHATLGSGKRFQRLFSFSLFSGDGAQETQSFKEAHCSAPPSPGADGLLWGRITTWRPHAPLTWPRRDVVLRGVGHSWREVGDSPCSPRQASSSPDRESGPAPPSLPSASDFSPFHQCFSKWTPKESYENLVPGQINLGNTEFGPSASLANS